MWRVGLAWMAVFGVGCNGSAKAASAPAVVEETLASVAAETLSAPTPPTEGEDLRSDGPLRIQPGVAGEGRLPHGPAHVDTFGWAADGESFALCSDGDCTFTFLDGKAERGAASPQGRLATDGHAPGPVAWEHGKSLTLTWSAQPSSTRLEFGATLTSGETVRDLVWMDFDPDLGDDVDIHPALVSASDDGTRLALVGHAVAADGRGEFKTILLSADDLAGRALSQAGQDHLGEERFGAAVASFEAAANAHPNSWVHPYNLAGARARLGSGDVREPLQRAIDLGGTKVRSKAQRDRALASVKRAPWFRDLVAAP